MATYYIGANDEHGQNPPTAGKRTPIMPYLDVPIYENQFNRPTKIKFLEACLRQGFDVFDVKPEIADVSISQRVARVNRQNLTALVSFGYNAFGTGNTFNSARGYSTFFSTKNVRAQQSRELAEEIYDVIGKNTARRGNGVVNLDIGVLSSVRCTSALVEPGFMTNLDEAKLMLDPDFQTKIAENTCQGLCNYLGVSYVARELANYPTVRQGARGNFVELLQYLLYQNGAITLDVDGIFGAKTTSAVVEFQKQNGLVADGIVGVNTWRTLLNLPPQPTLRRGSRGTYVKYAQNKLLSKLYPLGNADGIFGAKTETAVREFQRENNLAVDGVIGPATWSVLSQIGGGRT